MNAHTCACRLHVCLLTQGQWIHTYVHNQRVGLSLALQNLFPSKAQSSARLLIPPTRSFFISAAPNSSPLWSLSDCSTHSLLYPVSHLCPLLSFLQVFVAFISFSETMLLVYLSYKVSYWRTWDDRLTSPVMSVDVEQGNVCVGVCVYSICWEKAWGFVVHFAFLNDSMANRLKTGLKVMDINITVTMTWSIDMQIWSM